MDRTIIYCELCFCDKEMYFVTYWAKQFLNCVETTLECYCMKEAACDEQIVGQNS